MRLSIVVPVLNDALPLQSLLQWLVKNIRCERKIATEIIVVDGGSSDNSIAVAHLMADIVLKSDAGRALQMNIGAMAASGDYLLFLHADTFLPASFLKDISAASESQRWGFFRLCFDDQGWVFKIIAQLINWRSGITQVSTGDQCQYFQREFFLKIQQFPALALMEDVAISKAARRCCAPFVIQNPVQTQARRWQKNGIAKTVLLMWALRLAYWCGVDTKRLAKIYYGKPHV